MMKVILPNNLRLVQRRFTLPVTIGVLFVCLLAFVANQLKPALWGSNDKVLVAKAASSGPELGFAKKQLRYEATINNWKRYRSSEKPAEIAKGTGKSER